MIILQVIYHHIKLLNPPISKNKVIELENKYEFKLPEDYFWFITEVGNGGACHGYSMDKFEDMYFDYLKYDSRIDLMREYSKKVNEGNANDIENTDFEYYGILIELEKNQIDIELSHKHKHPNSDNACSC